MERIAIIEDDAATRMLLWEVLTEEGCEVILIEGPGDLLLKLAAARSDLVLLDLMLGDWGDGLALVGAIRADPLLARVPIIVLSAASRLLRQQAEELMDLRCHVLEKPFHLDDLLALIEAAAHEPTYRGSIQQACYLPT